jgi:hypothetical protein
MRDLHGANNGLPAEIPLYTIEAAIAEAEEQLNREHFPDSTIGIQHWVWTGTRLVRVSPEAEERTRQQEALDQEELRRLRERQKSYRQQRWQFYRRIAGRMLSPVRRMMGR